METVSVLPLSGFFSAAAAGGREMFTPFWSIGVTTMKMIKSTRQTSTRGVTLMSDLTSPAPWLPACMGSDSLAADRHVLLLYEEIHHLRRGVIHLQDEIVHSSGEHVENPDGGNRHEQSEG